MKINSSLSLALGGLFSLLFFFSTLSHQDSDFLPPRPNPRLLSAFIALQAWRHEITSDPKGFISTWDGPDVCSYEGVYCAPAPDDPDDTTVAGIDLNQADIAGSLPEELGLLADLALFHINSNRFSGTLPYNFRNLHLLYELDVSNNIFSGPFPSVIFCLPSLKFLDIRFNEFEGEVPSSLFDLKLDALFINNNKFNLSLPENLGNSSISVVVLANNNFNGCLPSSFAKMTGALKEIILVNVGLTGCLPPEIGMLKDVTVFDVSFNMLVGKLPESIGGMKNLELLNVEHNNLSGKIPPSICSLPKLENFTYSYNYFNREPAICLKLPDKDDRVNCIPDGLLQRSADECAAFYSLPVNCSAFGCSAKSSPPP